MEAKQQPRALVILAEKLLGQSIKNGLISYCPTMDLLAVVTVDEHTQIFRLNGQKVFSVPRKRTCETMKICWKSNGSLLAIAYSDNSIALIATQGGKTVHQIQCPAHEGTHITTLGWSVNFTDVPAIRDRIASSKSGTTVEDVVHHGFLGELSKAKLDLPSDLASLDVESILPKLSLLPPGAKEGEVFTTRSSIDALFHSKDGKAQSADVLLVGFDDGSAYLSVHDFFEVGRFEPEQVSHGSRSSRIIKHISHPYSSTQGLLLKREAPDKDELHFVPLDLRLINENGRQFSLLASKATQMQNVLRYVKECQVQIYNEFNASQTLPHRFIANVEDDLQAKENCGFTTAAFRLVATGDCSPVVKEWLVDQLGDRGQKRWEKAATTGYENTRRLIHENLLPALDRLAILASRLRGLSLFHKTASAFGLITLELDHIFDTLQCLQLLGHSALIVTDTELNQSTAFCAWLKQEIDAQSSEPTSTTNPDEPEKEPGFDYADIFNYIEGALHHSRLNEMFDIKADSDTRETADMPAGNKSIYDAYKTALRRVRDGSYIPQERLFGLAALVERLQKQCAVVFNRIAGTQQKKVRFGELVMLGTCDLEKLDMRMVVQEGEDNACMSYVALVAPDASRAKVLRLDLVVNKGVSEMSGLAEAWISAKPEGKIRDIKFIDDKNLCILLEHGDSASLFFVPYQGIRNDGGGLSYGPSGRRVSTSGEVFELLKQETISRFRQHAFTEGAATAAPMKIEINGRKGRRAVCVVFGQDQQIYRVFDLDSHAIEDEEGSGPHGDEDEAMDS